MRREPQPGPDRVAGPVHGDHRRPGGGREPDLSRAAQPGQRGGDPQRGVHQLLAAQHQHPVADAVRRAARPAGRRPVPAAPGPPGRSRAGRRRPPLPASAASRSRLLGSTHRFRQPAASCSAASAAPRASTSGASRSSAVASATTSIRTPSSAASAVVRSRSAAVRRSTSAAIRYRRPGRAARLQLPDQVQRGPAGGQLVVDQHQRDVRAEQLRIGRLQQVIHGVRMLLVEPDRRTGATGGGWNAGTGPAARRRPRGRARWRSRRSRSRWPAPRRLCRSQSASNRSAGCRPPSASASNRPPASAMPGVRPVSTSATSSPSSRELA